MIKQNRRVTTGGATIAFLNDTLLVSPLRIGTSNITLDLTGLTGSLPSNSLYLKVWNVTAGTYPKLLITSDVRPGYVQGAYNWTWSAPTATIYGQRSNQTVIVSFSPYSSSATVSVSGAFNPTRTGAFYKQGTISTTDSYSISRLGALVRFTLFGVTGAFTPTRLDTFYRQSSLAFANSFAGSRLTTEPRTSSIVGATSFLLDRLVNALRTTSFSSTETFGSSRTNAFYRQGSVASTDTFVATRETNLLKTLNLSFAGVFSPNRLIGALRLSLSPITMAFNADKVSAYLRLIALSQTLSLTASRESQPQRGSTTSITVAILGDRLLAVLRPVTVTGATQFQVDRIQDLYRDGVVSVASAFLVNKGLSRIVSLDIIGALNSIRTMLPKRTVATDALVSVQSQRVGLLYRGGTGLVSSLFSLDRLVDAFRSASFSPTGTFSSDQTSALYRQGSVASTEVFSLGRQLESFRAISALLASSFNAGRTIAFYRVGVSSVGVSPTSSRSLTGQRGNGLAIVTLLSPSRLVTILRSALAGTTGQFGSSRIQTLYRDGSISSCNAFSANWGLGGIINKVVSINILGTFDAIRGVLSKRTLGAVSLTSVQSDRTSGFYRAATVSAAGSFSLGRLLNIPRLGFMTATGAFTIDQIQALYRGGTGLVSSLFSLDRSLNVLRSGVMSVGSGFASTRLAVFFTAGSMAATVDPLGNRLLQSFRTLTNPVTGIFASNRIQELYRDGVVSVASAFLVNKGLSRIVSLDIIGALNSIRTMLPKRTVATDVLTSPLSQRIESLYRDGSMSVTSAFLLNKGLSRLVSVVVVDTFGAVRDLLFKRTITVTALANVQAQRVSLFYRTVIIVMSGSFSPLILVPIVPPVTPPSGGGGITIKPLPTTVMVGALFAKPIYFVLPGARISQDITISNPTSAARVVTVHYTVTDLATGKIVYEDRLHPTVDKGSTTYTVQSVVTQTGHYTISITAVDGGTATAQQEFDIGIWQIWQGPVLLWSITAFVAAALILLYRRIQEEW